MAIIPRMKTWDAGVVGGGIIGLSLALALRRRGLDVIVIERGEPGREASWAAAGMIAHCEQPPELRLLARESAKLYPAFVSSVEEESGMRADLRSEGTIIFSEEGELSCDDVSRLNPEQLHDLEPRVSPPGQEAFLLPEASVDPRILTAACAKAAHRLGISMVSGSAVTEIEISNLGVSAIVTERSRYPVKAAINCAGAWACKISPQTVPTKPVKGHMLALVPPEKGAMLLRHVVRQSGVVYIVPRSDGRIVCGSTIEEVGYDKRVEAATVQRLHEAAADLVPDLSEWRIHESWTGLRPGTPDNLPIMGATATQGHFVATGHFRDGILLAPITALVMSKIVLGEDTGFELAAFSPERFRASVGPR
jgi:glycine oxidase